ncbi:hypothetical protein [Streptomyces variegatus]|uniref:hypothetical protein n=1 Tax=Streptomyces variegatus TaxID=284040 RepID=UPI003C2E8AC6
MSGGPTPAHQLTGWPTATTLTLALATAATAPATAASPSGRPSIDGQWRMDGYGTVLSPSRTSWCATCRAA